MSDKVFLTAPIVKTEVTPDGGREVWGFATLEVKDKVGEIADYEGTVKAFEKWSQETSKRTGGKSQGNVRVMHQPIAAGKMIHWEPTETTVKDEDGNEATVKAIWTGTYIPPTKPDVIKDVDEGILSALSIGGAYEKRWWDDQSQAFRFIPELSEYSLVDNPCVPGADITQVISKAVAPWSKSERNLGGGENVSDELEKGAPKGSYEELSERIQDACQQKFTGPYRNWWDGYVVATFPDHVVVRDWENDTFWDIPYTIADDGCINLGDVTEVARIEEFVPVEAMKMMKAAETERDKLKTAADERAKKYGIDFKEGKGHLSPPSGKPTDPEDYGDPTNYAYPIDSSHIQAAVSYFNQDGQREDGDYSDAEWEVVGKRIAAAAKRLEGGEYKYEDGKIVTPSESDKGSDKSVNPEDIAKAAQEAGLTLEQVQAFFKALAPQDQPPAAPTNVPIVDGDGDKDNNKEFPNPPEGDEKINIEAGVNSVKTAEKEVGVDQKPGEAQPEQNPGNPLKADAGDLAKAGKAISKARLDHMKHAINHMKAAMDGTDYGPEHHITVENEDAGDGNTGEEAPPVKDSAEKSFTSMLNKSVGVFVSGEMEKTFAKFESMVKGLASADTLTKALERLEAVETLVKEIHETPQAGGPMLNGGSPDIAQMFKQAPAFDVSALEEQALENFVKTTTDPLVRDRIGQELAIRRAKGVLR